MIKLPTIILLGHGPTSGEPKPLGLPIMAVSGGYQSAERIDCLATLDRSEFFPAWVKSDASIIKHVPGYRDGWKNVPGVRAWRIGRFNGPVFSGTHEVHQDDRFNSLLFAVQVAHCLGFRRIVFHGCDLKGRGYASLRSTMAVWCIEARKRKLEWCVTSGRSAMADFLPIYNPMRPVSKAGGGDNRATLRAGIYGCIVAGQIAMEEGDAEGHLEAMNRINQLALTLENGV